MSSTARGSMGFDGIFSWLRRGFAAVKLRQDNDREVLVERKPVVSKAAPGHACSGKGSDVLAAKKRRVSDVDRARIEKALAEANARTPLFRKS